MSKGSLDRDDLTQELYILPWDKLNSTVAHDEVLDSLIDRKSQQYFYSRSKQALRRGLHAALTKLTSMLLVFAGPK